VLQLSELKSALPRGHALAGLALILLGESMVAFRHRPWTDFYFPIVWLGYVLFLDGTIERVAGRSLVRHGRTLFLTMLPVSAVFWWLFELFNVTVQNWKYVGAEMYTGLSYVTFATACFAFVLLAVWLSAVFLHTLLPTRGGEKRSGEPPRWLLVAMIGLGLVCLTLPTIFPRYAFGLIWGAMYFLLDPINGWLGRPTIIGAVYGRNWRLPVCFALGALMCGFFWEGWNFWALPKWTYSIPYVDQWHIFEMPLLGWIGYLPFGLELYAMTNFVLPFLGFQPLTLEIPSRARVTETAAITAEVPALP
jgi:hypothetical protein